MKVVSGDIMGKIKIRLADVPLFAKDEYHPDQVKFYAKITELMYKALNLGSIYNFIEEFVTQLGIKEDIEIRIMRLPSHKSRIVAIDLEKGKLLEEQQYARAWKKKPLIDIFPNALFISKNVKPHWSIGFRGFLLNSIIRALIHELLHKGGLKNENEVRRKTEEYYEEFRAKYLKQLEKELKPIVKEWKKFGHELGLG